MGVELRGFGHLQPGTLHTSTSPNAQADGRVAEATESVLGVGLSAFPDLWSLMLLLPALGNMVTRNSSADKRSHETILIIIMIITKQMMTTITIMMKKMKLHT